MNTNKNNVLISTAVVFKEQKGKELWFLVKSTENDEWEMPKVIVRKGESSVRAALRLMAEKGGMNTRVLEEAGRVGGTTLMNNKNIPQKHIYYLMVAKSGAKETIGFLQYSWSDYPTAQKKLPSKKEKTMLKEAKEVLKKWRKDHPRRKL